jgi:hypothetical protein
LVVKEPWRGERLIYQYLSLFKGSFFSLLYRGYWLIAASPQLQILRPVYFPHAALAEEIRGQAT